MGVVQICVAASADPLASFDLLSKAVQNLHNGQTKPKEWTVTGTAWQQVQTGRQLDDTMLVAKGTLKDVLMMEFEDLDRTVVMDRNGSNPIVWWKDITKNFQNLGYSVRMTMTFSGQEYAMGDFVVRVGTVVRHLGDVQTIAAVVVVHYTACVLAATASAIFEEFLAVLQAQIDQLKGDKLEWKPLSPETAPESVFGPEQLARSYWSVVSRFGGVKET